MLKTLPFTQRNTRLRVAAANVAVEEAVALGAQNVDDRSCVYAADFYKSVNPAFSWKTKDRGVVHVAFLCDMGSAYQNAYETLPIEVHRCLQDAGGVSAVLPLMNMRRNIRSSSSVEGEILRNELRESVKGLLAEIDSRP